MRLSLKELADRLGARLIAAEGDGVTISGVASLGGATTADLIFVDHVRFLDEALASRAGAVIAGDFAANGPGGKPLLICKEPRLSFARAAALLAEPPDQ